MEIQTVVEDEAIEHEEAPPPPPPPSLAARIKRGLRCFGCLFAFTLWLGLMATPCAFITLIVEKELVFERSDIPDHEVRLFMLDDSQWDARGLGLQIGSIKSGGEDEDEVCILVDTDYLIWEGEAEPLDDFCECYERIDDTWSITLLGDANCEPLEFDFAE